MAKVFSALATRLFVNDEQLTGIVSHPHLFAWSLLYEVAKGRSQKLIIRQYFTISEATDANIVADHITAGDYSGVDLLSWILLTADGTYAVAKFDTLAGLSPARQSGT